MMHNHRPFMAAAQAQERWTIRPHPVVYAALFSALVWGLLIVGLGSILS
ncbi:MAG: hypothetical protein R3C16_12560 [Hyphomonadaceae bacterium]